MGKLKQHVKQHVKLYNAVWEALHADDKFVVTSKLCHAELVPYLADALKDAAAQGGYSLIYFTDSAKSGVNAWAVLAEAALMALQLSDNQAGFVRKVGRLQRADVMSTQCGS